MIFQNVPTQTRFPKVVIFPDRPETLRTPTKSYFKYTKTGANIEFVFLSKENICQIPGVGSKVADCVLLFSLDKLEAVPLDRWIIRILEKYYFKKFEINTKTITEKQYNILHKKIVNHFGPFAGYSQQFLFKMERDIYQKKWL